MHARKSHDNRILGLSPIQKTLMKLSPEMLL